MELISQLFNAVTGAGTAPQNDANDASHEAGDLPPLPFGAGSSPSRSTHIDLTSPTRESPPQKQQARGDTDQRLPKTRHKKNEHERRLVGDYDAPADAVYAPDPRVNPFPPKRAMGKPGSDSAFKPFNNLYGSNHGLAPTPKKAIGYGKLDRIGYTRGSGELRYESRKALTPKAPARNVPAHQDQLYLSHGASPTKRRKTEGGRSSPAIEDFTGEEEASQEVQEVDPPVHSTIPTVRQTNYPRSSPLTQSRASGHTIRSARPSPQPNSEFKRSQEFFKLSKPSKKTQTPSSRNKSPFEHSVSGSTASDHQRTPIIIDEGEDVHRKMSNPRSIFHGFAQGESRRLSDAQESPEQVRSKFFPQAQINESTNEAELQTGHSRRGPGIIKNLRNHRRAGQGDDDFDPIVNESPDELGMDTPPRKTTSMKRQASPSKARYAPNKSVKRKPRAEKDSPAWRLTFARSHEWETRVAVIEGGNVPFLTLQPDPEDPSVYCIKEADRQNLHSVVKHRILPKDVIKVQADETRRMRLEGPRDFNGIYALVDIEFQLQRDFNDFMESFVVGVCPPNKLFGGKDSAFMREVLKKPLPRLPTKKGNHHATEDSAVVDIGPHGLAESPPSTQDIPGPRKNRQQVSAPVGKQSAKEIFAPTQPRSRPTRASRSTAPVHDLEEVVERNAVEKYSIVHGLGKPWVKPLTYAVDRQRAVVNFDDLPRLDDEEMLNDSLIDFYMIYLYKKYQVPDNKIYFFNTYFFTKLTEKTGRSAMNYKAVERWTNKVDIFLYDYVVVPINEGMHWYLAIICNINNIKRKPADSNDDVIETQSRDKLAVADDDESDPKPTVPAESEKPRPSETPVPAEDLIRGEEDDTNLFDEQSISLVDREDPGPLAGEGENAQASSVPHSPRGDEQSARAACAGLEQDTAPNPVFSSPKPVKEPKKKMKRKAPIIKRDPSEPVIIVLDSLTNGHSGAVRALKDWLSAEGLNRRGMEAEIKEKGVYPKSDQIPTQNNFSDCGVYVLGYVEKFFQDPDDFKRKLLVGAMTAEDDWPLMNVCDMRNNLRNTLFELAKEQGLTVPQKPKKPKKAGEAAKKVPTPPGSQPVNGVLRGSPAKQAAPVAQTEPVAQAKPATQEESNAQADSPKTINSDKEPAKAVSTMEATGTGSESQSINGLPGPRLGSPFAPQPRRQRSASPEITVGKGSDSSPVSMSPPKRITICPQKQQKTPGRRLSPEVRIPAKTPTSIRYIQRREVNSEAPRTKSARRQLDKARSVSPLKTRRQAIGDKDDQPPVWDENEYRFTKAKRSNGDDLRTNGVGKSAKSVSAEKRQPASRSGISSLHDQRDGSSDQPIEIEDSQETRVQALKSPRDFFTGSPAQRKQPLRARQDMQILRHAPSVEEIPPPEFMLRQSPRKQRQPEPDADLVAHLDAEDRALSLERRQSDPDAMDIDAGSQGVDSMDTAMDEEIGETPEARRMSPVILPL